jgi:DNA-binding response OmpR family regulator
MVISETQTGNRMAEVLRGEEMTPSIAGDKQEALRQLDKEPPDAVIVNLDGAGS